MTCSINILETFQIERLFNFMKVNSRKNYCHDYDDNIDGSGEKRESVGTYKNDSKNAKPRDEYVLSCKAPMQKLKIF